MLDQGVGPNADGSVASDMSVASDQGMAMTDVFVVTPADSGTAQTADDGMPADAQLQVDAAQSDQGPAPDAGACTLTCAAWSQLNEVNCVCRKSMIVWTIMAAAMATQPAGIIHPFMNHLPVRAMRKVLYSRAGELPSSIHRVHRE